jgi:hypothetical protein
MPEEGSVTVIVSVITGIVLIAQWEVHEVSGHLIQDDSAYLIQ